MMMTNNISYRFIVTYQEHKTNKNKGIAIEDQSNDWSKAILEIKNKLEPKDTILGVEMKKFLVTPENNK